MTPHEREVAQIKVDLLELLIAKQMQAEPRNWEVIAQLMGVKAEILEPFTMIPEEMTCTV